MEITTPVGDDVLLFYGMHAREELGRLGEYQLDLLSQKKDINPNDILGKNVTVKVELPDESIRYFNGFVTRFAQGGLWAGTLLVVVHPGSGPKEPPTRIFQEMTVRHRQEGLMIIRMPTSNELTGSAASGVACSTGRPIQLLARSGRKGTLLS
jgi:hypothetical protein